MVTIYVLELEHNKYYVGKSKEIDFCLEQHFNCNEIKWTQIHKPISVMELIKNCEDSDVDKYTLEYMEGYGIKNVRGGSYYQIKLNKKNKSVINEILNMHQDDNNKNDTNSDTGSDIDNDIDSINDVYDVINDDTTKKNIIIQENDVVCYRCGRIGHLVESCYAKTHFRGKKLDGCYKCGRDDHQKEKCEYDTDIYGRKINNGFVNMGKKILNSFFNLF